MFDKWPFLEGMMDEDLKRFLKEEVGNDPKIFPPKEEVFRAFDFFEIEKSKVVIFGQDPYPTAGQANGLCFSVNSGIEIPFSLKKIFQAINEDLGIEIPENGDLTRWARQGVLLLNTALTVRESNPGSHEKIWENFTNQLLSYISNEKTGVVYMLWGEKAKNKEKEGHINSENNLILRAHHPAYLSRKDKFQDCKHFSKANAYLYEQGLDRINW